MVGYSFTFSTGGSVAGNGTPSVTGLTASAYPASPGAAVTLSAAATDPDSDPLQYRFDFGDGTPKTAWSSAASAVHAFASPGHYQAVAQARDGAGALASRTVTVTVLDPPAGPLPTSSSSVHCDSASRRVWTVNPDNDTVAAVDADTLAKVLEVAVCADPRSLARSSAGEIWVACHDGDAVAVLDAAGGLLAEIPTGYGSAPYGLVFSPGGGTAWVTLQGSGELRRFDAATRLETGNLVLGPSPRAVAVSGDGARVLVTRFLSPAGHAEVWDVDAASLSLARTLRIPKLGGDLNRDTTASGRGVANYLTGLAISPDGTGVRVASNKPNAERGLVFAHDLDQDNTVRNLLSRLDLASGALAGTIDVDNSDSAAAVAYAPLGDYVFVALQGNDEVVVFDALLEGAASGLGGFVTRLGAGAAPQGLCVDAPASRVFVQNLLGRGVTAIEAEELFRSGDKAVPSTEVSTAAAEALAPEVLLGKRLFYGAGDPRISAEGYLSCATCHVDGGQDGRVWDFTGRGEGFRNTTSLRGRAGTGHGNVHWTANFDEIQDFENDIRGAFGGRGLMSDADFAATSATLGPAKAGLSADLDALAAYVSSLGRETIPRSPYRDAGGAMTAQALAGRALFGSLDCGVCHAGDAFTDSAAGGAPVLHDVGTIRTTSGGRLGGPLAGIDTPTLLGVWASAPYLHDGSAETLEDVFRVAGGEVLQAESGAVSSGADVVVDYVDLNNDDTVPSRSYVGFDASGARLVHGGVDGGSGGAGALEIRYSAGYLVHELVVRVNGVPRTVFLAPADNDPQWRHTDWRRFRIEGVAWAPAPTNTLDLRAVDAFPNLSIDDVLVTTADDLAAALPHRRVLGLSPGDRAALTAYLLQLDGQPEENPSSVLFTDGFESGGAERWSQVVP
jgi:DNA-binding beta-propeller fold protein YncE